MKKPRILIIITAIILGSLTLQLLLARKAQSQPRRIVITKKVVASKAAAAKKKVAAKKTAVARKAAPTLVNTMPFYNFKVQSLDGKPVDLDRYQGKTILVVNTASKCGYTKQYAGLEALHEKYAKEGLVVLGFPANNFGGQEPGTNSEIGEFCQKNFGVKFDMFAKSSVKGDDQAPLFRYLTTEANPDLTGEIGWNFEKFLISRDGKLVARFKSAVAPDAPELTQALEAELAKK